MLSQPNLCPIQQCFALNNSKRLVLQHKSRTTQMQVSFIKQTLKNNIAIQTILITALFILLDYEYRKFVVVYFANLNFSFDFHPGYMALSILIFTICMLSMHKMRTSPFMNLTSVVVIIFFLIPNLIIFHYMQTNIMIPLSIMFLILLLRVRVNTKKILQHIPVLPEKSIQPILLTLSLLFLIPIFLQFGFNFIKEFSLTDFASHYEIREGVSITINRFTAYGFGQLIKAILPVMLLYGIIRKKHLLVSFSIIATGYIFLVNPHKSFIIALLPIFLFVLYNDYHKKAILFITLFIALIMIFKVISIHISIVPESLLVRRSLFTQAFLTNAYFEFFNGNPQFLAHSVFSPFINYSYHLPPAYLIGDVYFSSPTMSCNTGVIGDGFMNFGYAGVILFCLIVASIFHIIDNLELHPSYYGLTFLIIFQIQNSPLTTTLITHGILLLLLIMVFLLRQPTVYKR